MSTSSSSKKQASEAQTKLELSKSPEAPSDVPRKSFEGWEAFLQHLKAEKDAGRPVDLSKAKVTMRLADGTSYPLGPAAAASAPNSSAQKPSQQPSAFSRWVDEENKRDELAEKLNSDD